MKPLDDLAQSQVEKRLKSIRGAFAEAKVRPGWINYMRHALGMTLEKLAERAGIAKPTAAQAERGEAKGKVTIDTLKKMAAAMECEFIYAFVPKTDVHTILKEKAYQKAKLLISEADTHMTLEDQQVKDDLKGRIDRLAKTLLEKGDVW